MPYNPDLQAYEFRTTSERLHQDRLRRLQRMTELDEARQQAGLPSRFGDTGGTTTTTTGRPTLPELPEFELPEYEESEVASLAQKIAAPKVRRLRETTRAAIATRGPGYENPNIRRMTVRQALQGYGTGLESIISGARSAAVSEYGQQYAPRVAAAQLTYQTQVGAKMAEYGNLWKEYLQELAQTGGETAGERYLRNI